MLLYFAFTLFVSSSLLFLVQPMIGKMILPRLGGTPAVWNTCMVFFQAVLLVGYAYTHSVSTWQNRKLQVVVQVCLLALPFAVLPFALGAWAPPAESNPVLAVLWLLLGLVGLPFFVVATSAPLLQKWFASTGHAAAKDPYFLYGASNLGSMLALLCYPLFVEPLWSVDEQTVLWTMGYGFMVVLVAGCAAWVWQSGSPPTLALAEASGLSTPAPAAPSSPPAAPTAIRPAARRHRSRGSSPAAPPQGDSLATGAAGLLVEREVTWPRRLRWIGLAAAPSSLMLGVTTYLTTDISAIPLFWVVPLALYLLTFILVFARWPVVWTGKPHEFVLVTQPFFVMCLVLVRVAQLEPPTWLMFLIHLSAFFTTALLCHGELAKDRPPISHLTEFYLWMSVGGVLGGMFNALLAPLVFSIGVVEYYLALALGCMLRPSLVGGKTFIPGDSQPQRRTLFGLGLDVAIPLALALITCLVIYITAEKAQAYRHIFLSGPVFLVLLLMTRPWRFALAMLLVLGVAAYFERRENLLFERRTYYGFIRVQGIANDDGQVVYHYLLHGGINHGGQYVDRFHRRLPITYFHPTGGIGQVFEKFSLPYKRPKEDPQAEGKKRWHQLPWLDWRLPVTLAGLGAVPGGILTGVNSELPYGVIGLGIGTLAAHARPYQHVTFYEIDPAVKHLSLPPEGEKQWFYYLQDAEDRGADPKVVLGDGRLKLMEAPDKYYHILVIDAFSSDAIPVHLLTVEALELYLQKLADAGVLVFNTTNRYVDLQPVLADVARALDLECLAFGDWDEDIKDKFGSDWLVMQRKNLTPGMNGGPPLHLRLDMRHWSPPKSYHRPAWRDSYSNLLQAMKWGR